MRATDSHRTINEPSPASDEHNPQSVGESSHRLAMIPSIIEKNIKLLKQYRRAFAEASSPQQTIAAAEQIKRILRDISQEVQRHGSVLAHRHRKAQQKALTWLEGMSAGYQLYLCQPLDALPHKSSVGRLDFDLLGNLPGQVWVT